MGWHQTSDGGGITGFLCVTLGEGWGLMCPAAPLAHLRLISASLLVRDNSCESFPGSARCQPLTLPGFTGFHFANLLQRLCGLSVMNGSKALLRNPYSQKNSTIWGGWDDLPPSPSCWCTGAKGGLDGANDLVNYSPLFIRGEFVEGLRQSIYIS